MKDKITELCEKVKWLHEAEYGDFKRKVNLYLERTKEVLPSEERETKKKLEELKFQLLYAPNADMEATRALILAKLCGSSLKN